MSTIHKLLNEFVSLLVTETLRAKLTEAPIKRKMHIPLPQDLLDISKLFQGAGKEFFLVGGSVRDALLGKEPKDLDVATNATPDQAQEILSKDPSIKVLELGKAFGVIKALTSDGNEYEIATFRKDLSGGRRPDAVEFTSIEQDVARRDLTMNALFYDIEKGEVVDFVGGMDDIEKGIVRTVGDPSERFGEDRLRILRALRFAGRLGTKLDGATAAAIKADNSLAQVSGERIRDEFIKGIKSAKSVPYFLSMISEFGLWTQIFPGLAVNTTKFAETKNVPVQLALLLSPNRDWKKLTNRMNASKYPADEVTQVGFLSLFQELSPDSAFKLKKLFRSSKLTNKDLMEFSRLSGKPDLRLVSAFVKYTPAVTGAELQAQGFSGRELGQEQDRLETQAFKKLLQGKA